MTSANCMVAAIAEQIIRDTGSKPHSASLQNAFDMSCRGYPIGEEVKVEDRADGMACVRAKEDAACFWVREGMAPSTLTGGVK